MFGRYKIKSVADKVIHMFFETTDRKQNSRRGQVQSNQHVCDEVLYEEINTLKEEIRAIKESMFILMSLLPNDKKLQLQDHIGQKSKATNEIVVLSDIESDETKHRNERKKVNLKLCY